MNVNKDPNSKKIFVVDSENVDVFSLLKHLYFVSDYSLVLTGCPPPHPLTFIHVLHLLRPLVHSVIFTVSL